MARAGKLRQHGWHVAADETVSEMKNPLPSGGRLDRLGVERQQIWVGCVRALFQRWKSHANSKGHGSDQGPGGKQDAALSSIEYGLLHRRTDDFD